MFYQDLFTCMLAWARSRPWKRLILLAILPGLVFVVTGALILYGALLSRQQLAGRYFALVRTDVESRLQAMEGLAAEKNQPTEKAAALPDGQAPASQQVDEDGDPLSLTRHQLVPLRRIMQLGNSNERVTYLVAAAMADQGRGAMAAQMLREIAPVGGGGFPLAHAFLANYALSGWKGTEAQAEVLLADFWAAEGGGVKLKLTQLRIMASLLLKFDRKTQAINLLTDHAQEYPELNGDIVQIEANEGSSAREALAAGRAAFEEKRKAQILTFDDLRQAVRLELLDKQIDRALELAELGGQFGDRRPEAVRLLSDVLLAKHQFVSKQRELDVDRAEALRTVLPPLDLQYLDRACRIDSSSPAVSQELAKAMALGQGLSEEMKKTLKQSLVDGTATGVTHLILANRKLMDEEPQTALPQLRLALQKMPDSPIVMNNLAYAIMKYDQSNLSEAKQLVERALTIPGAAQAERASMLDTLGEIRVVEGDLLGAIEVFEDAIKLDGNKVNTRRKLADAYTKAGMRELAQGQLAKVKELSQK